MDKRKINAPKQSKPIISISLNDISIKSIVRDVIRRVLVIVLCAIVFGGGFYIAKSESFKPQYTSEATMLVSTKNGSYDAYSNLSTAVQMNQVFQMILASNALQDAVMEDLNVSELDAKIEAVSVEETNLLTLKVTSSTPVDSYYVLCSVIRNYPLFSNEIMTDAVMDVFEAPTIPTKANNYDDSLKFGVIGLLVGALISFVGIVLLSILNDTVKNQNQLNDKLSSKLYATIPHEKRKIRRGILISDATSSFEIKEAFNMLSSRLQHEKRNNGYKIFSINSVSDNEGKTTICSNLAICLAEEGFKTLLIDLDFNNPNIYSVLNKDIPSGKDLFRLFVSDNKDLSHYIISSKKTNLDMLLSNGNISNTNQIVSHNNFDKAVLEISKNYDYVIIDNSSIANIADINDIISFADASLLVVREDYTKSIKINDAIDLIKGTNATLLGVIFNDSINEHHSSSYGYAYGSYSSSSSYYKKYNGYSHYSNNSVDNN